MQKRWILFMVLCVFMVLGFMGCEKSNPAETSTNDKEAMREIVSNDALFQADQVLLDDKYSILFDAE
jgi:hypothetical protein